MSVESIEATETVNEVAAPSKRTFFGSTLKEMLPVLIVLVVVLTFSGVLAVDIISDKIAEAERHAENIRLMKGLIVR